MSSTLSVDNGAETSKGLRATREPVMTISSSGTSNAASVASSSADTADTDISIANVIDEAVNLYVFLNTDFIYYPPGLNI